MGHQYYNALQYKNLIPEDKFVKYAENPPEMYIEFFEEQRNLDLISCYSNEGSGWNNTNIKFDNHKLRIFFRENFKERRGRINCSLKDKEGWRWLGVQFSIKLN